MAAVRCALGLPAHQPGDCQLGHQHGNVAGGDPEEQVRLAQHLERIGALPVGLRDEPHAQPPPLEEAGELGIRDGIRGDEIYRALKRIVR